MKHVRCISIILFLSIILTSCIDREAPVDKSKLLGHDFRLFQGTIAWDLAKAVQDQDIARIKYEVEQLGIPVDYKESKWKKTLLMLATDNNKKKSVKVLLELGANPNVPCDTVRYRGDNSVILASRFSHISPEILKMLLEYGGDPNSVECGVQQDNFGNWVPARHFALFAAVGMDGDYEKVRMLVEAGADVNMQSEDTGAGAMERALVFDRMDVLLYLLEHGADYNRKFERIEVISSQDSASYKPFYVNILYELRLRAYPLNSKKHKEKLKVIDFLKKRGMDYWKSPVPDRALTKIKREISPKNEEELQEYLKRY